MHKRPLSISIIGYLFVVVGIVGLTYHATGFKGLRPFDYELVWVCLVRLLAILGGVFLLRGHNWARWLLIVWLAYHVVLSVFHSWPGVVMHSVLLVVIAYFLLRPQVSAYFGRGRGLASTEEVLSPQSREGAKPQGQ